MRVLFVASECFPYVKTGGLADVAGALPPALRALGLDVRILLPGYPGVLGKLDVLRTVRDLRGLPALPPDSPARLLATLAGDGEVPLYVLDVPAFFARAGSPYLGPDGQDWPDNHLRFGALSRTAALLGLDGDGDGWLPDILHCHDWQAGLAPAYLAYPFFPFAGRRRPKTVFTIHNLAFQGLFPAETLPLLGLPWEAFTPQGLEFHGKLGFLKAGLAYADKLTTVSPTYAAEIQGGDFGFGLDGLLRLRAADLSGILNGIDLDIWDPARDPLLPARYDATTLEAKTASKSVVQQAFGLADRPNAPLFGIVSRLTHQKGIDLVVEALPRLVSQGAQLAVLGTGSRELEQALAKAAADNPGRVGVRLAYDEALSHQVQAGSDVLMVPSRFEPCGLTQMYALRYGTLPLVARVGGLNDTVTDVTEQTLADGTGTGFVFAPVEVGALVRAIDRSLALFRAPHLWHKVQQAAMSRDVGWAAPAREYDALYGGLLAEGV